MLSIALLLPAALLSAGYPPLVRGTLVREFVHSAGLATDSRADPVTLGVGYFATLRLELRGGARVHRLSRFGGTGTMWTLICRWQIIDGRLISPMQAFGSSESAYPSQFRLFSVPLDKLVAAHDEPLDDEERQRRSKDCSNSTYGFPVLGNVLGSTIWESEANRKRISFDVWSRGGRFVEVYVANPGRNNRLSREDLYPEREKGPFDENKPPWVLEAEWKFDWSGPFYVAVNGDDRFFVTDTGRVFIAPRNAKPMTPLKEIWKGPPVDALIHDSDAKKFYGFTKDQFFEIADPIKPMPHAIRIKRSWTANAAIETAAECGHVIRTKLAPKMTERTWDELASRERRVGHNAVWAMSKDPSRAIPLLKERLRPVPMPPAKEVAALIANLGAESFAAREAAEKRLRELSRTVEPAVRVAATTATNPEARKRLNQLLTDWKSDASLTADEVRAQRAVLALERIGTPAARALLEEWAKGTDSAVLTREARKALR